MKQISLYIHIPFCESKCSYCDFTSYVGKTDMIKPYMDALKKELLIYEKELEDYEVKTIFFGGGTPTCIDPIYIYDLLKLINYKYSISESAEITIESNPGSITKEKISMYKDAGINRVSVGAQSFDDKLLKYIGRTHSEKDIYKAIEIIRSEEIENINLDLMFALPNQDFKKAISSINKAIELDVKHISNYGLILEGNTPMHNSYLKGEIDLMDVELDRKIYHKTREILKKSNYDHYEISNYAKNGYQSIHNRVYWDVNQYIGLGVSSHSNFKNKRYANTNNIFEYIEKLENKKLPIVFNEYIDEEEEIIEVSIMGFRKIEGIDTKHFEKRFNKKFKSIYREEIEKNIKNGLIKWDGDNLKLTEKGLDFSNQVELDFFSVYS